MRTSLYGAWRPARYGTVAALFALLLGACAADDPSGPGARAAGDSLGAEVYAATCASCHGADLRGTDRGPSHLSIVYEPSHHPDASFRSAIVNGVPQHHWSFGDMAPVPGLTDEEIDAVIAFVREAQNEEGFEPYPPR